MAKGDRGTLFRWVGLSHPYRVRKRVAGLGGGTELYYWSRTHVVILA